MHGKILQVQQINELEPEMQKLSDLELRDKTGLFKKRLQNGETLDDLLVDVFAVCSNSQLCWCMLFPSLFELRAALSVSGSHFSQSRRFDLLLGF